MRALETQFMSGTVVRDSPGAGAGVAAANGALLPEAGEGVPGGTAPDAAAGAGSGADSGIPCRSHTWYNTVW